MALYLAAVLIFLLKFQHRSMLLAWWDSAQFGLALERFNVVEHRPHPPGYPLYILWGKLCTFLIDNPNLSFVFIGLLLSVIASVIVFKLVRGIFHNDSIAWLAAALYTFAPLTIYHELKALTYVISAFFSVLVAFYAWEILEGRSRGYLKITLAIGLMGMIRPYESILLLPLAIWSISKLGYRKLIISSLIYIFLQILWIIPVALLSGGFNQYFSAIASEGGKHERNFMMLVNKPLAKLVMNLRAIYYYLRQSYPGWAFFSLVSVIYSVFRFREKRKTTVFFILWGLPALILYSLNYVNYAGICLFLSPLFAILIAKGIHLILLLPDNLKFKFGKVRISAQDSARLCAIAVSFHLLVIFFSLDLYFGETFRKYDPDAFNMNRLLAGDAYVMLLRDSIYKLSVENSDPESVLVMSDLNYRVLMYYLPKTKILWTRYLCQRESGGDGGTRYGLDRNDHPIKLPSCEMNGKNYWFYRLTGREKIAIFTDEMLPNIKGEWVGGLLPVNYEGMENAVKAYAIDLNNVWGFYFRQGEFGVIDFKTASRLDLDSKWKI